MYQDRPGPDSTTVISCVEGQVYAKWLDAVVNVEFDAKAMLKDVLESITAKLDITEVVMGDHAKTLSLKEPFYYNGSIRGALEELNKRFADDKLQCFMQQSRLCAICLERGDYINLRQIKYISAPLLKNPGDEYGNGVQQVTAPWMPDLRPGDLLEIPAEVYRANFSTVGRLNLSLKQKMQVTTLSFHFGTSGTINQMVCMGFIVG